MSVRIISDTLEDELPKEIERFLAAVRADPKISVLRTFKFDFPCR